MGLLYEVGDTVTLKKSIHAEAESGKSFVWELIFV